MQAMQVVQVELCRERLLLGLAQTAGLKFATDFCADLRRPHARVRPRARVCAFYPAGLVAGHHPCSMADCRARREPRRMPLISPMRTR